MAIKNTPTTTSPLPTSKVGQIMHLLREPLATYIQTRKAKLLSGHFYRADESAMSVWGYGADVLLEEIVLEGLSPALESKTEELMTEEFFMTEESYEFWSCVAVYVGSLELTDSEVKFLLEGIDLTLIDMIGEVVLNRIKEPLDERYYDILAGDPCWNTDSTPGYVKTPEFWKKEHKHTHESLEALLRKRKRQLDSWLESLEALES